MKLNFPLVINEEPQLENFVDYPGKMRYIAYEVAHWQWLRCRLSEAQNWKCCWCGCNTTDERKKWNSSTIEHVIPKSFGGSDDPSNLAMSCNRCNNNRGDMDAEMFMRKVND
jgi:5-methylcytosine-specific restriction endonuclease McrA